LAANVKVVQLVGASATHDTTAYARSWGAFPMQLGLLSCCLAGEKASLGGRERTVLRWFTTAGVNPCLSQFSTSLFIQIYGESSSCAGRALRNIFTLQASDLIKDRVYLTGICR